ncbi:MAG: hypothetical protein JWO02_3673 [Solirubrobacterales bacterium]|nr:hypothetical protein [Solirubrobacterales bacterium]
MDTEGPTRAVRPKRIGLAVAALLLSVNIWTGAPLFAVWVGSKAAGDSGISMGALFLVVVVLAVSVFALAEALAWVSATDDRMSGRPSAARRTSPWLRSMRGEREETARSRYGISPVERAVVVSVVAAVVVFELWLMFFAGSPLPKG